MGDYFSGTPWFMVNGSISGLVCTGNFITVSGGARAWVFNGGLHAAFFGGNYFDTTLSPIWLLRGYQNTSSITVLSNEFPIALPMVQVDPSILQASLNPPQTTNYAQIPGLFMAGNYLNENPNTNIVNIDAGYIAFTGCPLTTLYTTACTPATITTYGIQCQQGSNTGPTIGLGSDNTNCYLQASSGILRINDNGSNGVSIVRNTGKLGIGADASAGIASKVQITGNVECVTNPHGFVLASPNGTRYLIQVDNSGNLSTTGAP
jgi:hypothetical protein